MDKKAQAPKPSPKSLPKSQEEAVPILPVKREGTKHVATLPANAKTAALPEKGIVAAAPDKPATLNGVPIETPRLTGKALEIREAQKAYLRSIGVPLGGAPVVATGPIDKVVMSPSNPYLSLFHEFRCGQITYDEMMEAIDVKVISDAELMRGYEAKDMPTKPRKLTEAEEKYMAKAPADEWESGLAELRIRLKELDTEIAGWMRSCEKIKSENGSNLFWLEDMLSRQAEKNQIFASKIRQAIYTHKAA